MCDCCDRLLGASLDQESSDLMDVMVGQMRKVQPHEPGDQEPEGNPAGTSRDDGVMNPCPRCGTGDDPRDLCAACAAPLRYRRSA